MKKSKTDHPLHVRATLRLYYQASMRHKRDAYLALLVPIANIFIGVIVPLFASKVLAEIAAPKGHIWTYFFWFVVSAVVGLWLDVVGIRHLMKLQARTMDDIHNTVFAHLMQRSVGFYNNQVGGKLVSDAIGFSASYLQLFNAGFVTAGNFLITTVVGLIVLFVSSWVIGLCVTVLLIGLGYWTYIETLKRSGMRTNRLEISQRLTSHLSDNIVNAVTVKTFAQEVTELRTNQRINSELSKVRMHDWLRTVTNENERMGILLLLQIVLVFVLIHLTQQNPHLLGAGIFAFTYTLTLTNRFFTLNTTVRQIEEAFLQASPMTELMGQPPEIIDSPDAKPLIVDRGEIICRDVTFHYADSKKQDTVFENLNLTIEPGQKVGLVGHSGGGKSTLTRLLLRFDDITSGSITIDGQAIKTVTQASLRQHISYVPQEPLLFHRSIKANIAYGKPDATDAEIAAAAQKAFAHDFIMQLPDGYDTIVGERGVKLSGGQRQRVAIARAVLKDSSILILDEATSALDSESEKVIQEALWELMDGKTAIVIAHRLSTIQRLDRIIVLDEGKIIEDGTHQALLKNKGLYARLWGHQSGGFIED
jgi:ATP-binding cassette subfamily B protein